MQTLLETSNEVYQEIVESAGNKKNYYLSGVYTECDVKNNNNRTYPYNIVEREIKNLSPKVESNVAFGEFGHPKDVKDMPEVNPEKISHRITEIKNEGKNFIGKAVLIPSGLGQTAINIIETGGILSVSSRGLGNVNKSGLVESNYKLYTYDLVINPGMKKATQNAILEMKEYFVNEVEFFTESEWRKIEKNRKQILEGVLFKTDLLSGLLSLKEIK